MGFWVMGCFGLWFFWVMGFLGYGCLVFWVMGYGRLGFWVMDALNQMRIELNGENMGQFVDKTVSALIYA